MFRRSLISKTLICVGSELRLHPCGHATACIACTLRLIPRASTLWLKCSHCRAAASAVEMLGVAVASAEQPALARHPTFGAIGPTAGVSLEEFVRNVSMSEDAALAALPRLRVPRLRVPAVFSAPRGMRAAYGER